MYVCVYMYMCIYIYIYTYHSDTNVSRVLVCLEVRRAYSSQPVKHHVCIIGSSQRGFSKGGCSNVCVSLVQL